MLKKKYAKREIKNMSTESCIKTCNPHRQIPPRAAAGMQMWSIKLLKNNIQAIINVLAFVLCTRCCRHYHVSLACDRHCPVSVVLAGIALTKKQKATLAELVIIA